MNKASQFLLLVQTAVIIRNASGGENGASGHHRAVWAMEHMNDACKVAERIPANVEALGAAQTFVRWLFKEDKEEGDQAILEILIADGI